MYRRHIDMLFGCYIDIYERYKDMLYRRYKDKLYGCYKDIVDFTKIFLWTLKKIYGCYKDVLILQRHFVSLLKDILHGCYKDIYGRYKDILYGHYKDILTCIDFGKNFAQSAGAVEYTNCTAAEG